MQNRRHRRLRRCASTARALLLASLLPAAVAACATAARGAAEAGGEPPAPPADPPAVPSVAEALEAAEPFDLVPTPASFLGRPLGARFTRHHEVVDYFEALGDASDRVRVIPYGASEQHRPLLVAAISSAANIERLDEIRTTSTRLADPTLVSRFGLEEMTADQPAIVWLSYNVHGNEPSCTEAALRVAWALASATEGPLADVLDDVVVVIDPCLNPDGRERYVSFFEQTVGRTPNPNPDTAEHREPWPSGRPNHYLFDLNRDWVWGTQVESRQRLALYRTFLPQVHIDYHEQGMDSPYFTGQGDTPYSANIPMSDRAWHDALGTQKGRSLDEIGTPWATKERFDYLYPGYGKVLPVYHGAIGLLTEQGGHGRAGLTVTVDDEHGPGLVLTLSDRLENHVRTSLATVLSAGAWREPILERFAAYFSTAAYETPDDLDTGWAILPSTERGRVIEVLDLLARHGIRHRVLEEDVVLPPGEGLRVMPPFALEAATTLPAGTIVVPAAQPMGRLARTLLERDPVIEDRDTYDITAWSVSVQFGLDVIELRTAIDGWPAKPGIDGRPRVARAPRLAAARGALALLVPSDPHRFPEAMALAAKHDLFARYVGEDLVPGDAEDETQVVPTGSLLVHRSRNDPSAFEAFAVDVARAGLPVVTTRTGATRRGPALGNNANPRFITPRIVLARGTPLSSLSFGHTWHLLDVVSPTPHAVVNVDDLDRVDWSEVNVLVLPSGRGLDGALRGVSDELDTWVRGGGTVVALARSARWATRSLLDVEDDENVPTANGNGNRNPEAADPREDPYSDEPERDEDDERELHELTYEQREARSVDRRVPGALLHAVVDATHPMNAGVAADLGFHVFSATPLPVRDDGEVLARFGALGDDGAPRLGGSISSDNLVRLAGTPAVTRHRHGRGQVIAFASDPTNRGMNRAAMRLLLNAILHGPSFSPGLQPLGEE